MNILLCTLGASWAVIPEIFGFVAADQLDLYAHHPERQRLADLQKNLAGTPLDELWVCTTEGAQTRAALDQLKAWWKMLGAPMPLRIWTASGTDQLATQAECDHIRELILRAALLASERCAAGQLILSLAGGRKTMSADLQWAGTLFGARALLHVVGPDPLPEALARKSTPALFTQALPSELAAAITPLVVGSATRDDLLDVALDGDTVNSQRFPLPLADGQNECAWPLPADQATLTADIQHRQQQGSRLFGNFIAQLAEDEKHENWRSLYRLPPARIDALRKTPLTASDHGWLVALPKADLHRHLGGCLSLEEQQKIGQAVWNEASHAERQQALADVAAILEQREWPWDWPKNLSDRLLERLQTRPGSATFEQTRAIASAALLVHATPTQLEHNLYGVTEVNESRLALKTRHKHGFSAYERPGELTGSAILGHPAALAPYAQALVRQACSEGLVYLELRGSPQKYRPDDPAGFVQDLAAALATAGANVGEPCTADANAPIFRFLWILDRRHPGQLARVLESAVAARPALKGFLVGLDLAGDEKTDNIPATLAGSFTAAFKDCLPITIHAGEGEDADKIWQAAYHLHADRIGHGLTLADHPQLAARFRNRGIGIELCPSSNREVVGFHDPEIAASAGLPAYPLRQFLELGLPLTLGTDNPGISRTTLANEYITAARMTAGGLTHWEVLALIKQGFSHNFLPAAEREALMKRIDKNVFRKLTENIAALRGN